MTEVFKIGDVVRLKSGGPEMTIIDILQDDTVDVAWSVAEVSGGLRYELALLPSACVEPASRLYERLHDPQAMG